MPEDVSSTELVAGMETVLAAHPGALCYVKYTCPRCGARVLCDEPNAFRIGGYVHEECGELYKGDQFGLLVLLARDRTAAREVMAEWFREDREKN